MITLSDALVVDLINVVADFVEAACVYHVWHTYFKNIFPIVMNYVGNKKFNNPYSNTYNPGWRNHPKKFME